MLPCGGGAGLFFFFFFSNPPPQSYRRGRTLAATKTLQHCLEGNNEPAANSLSVLSSYEHSWRSIRVF